jgi:3-(3-hydroxy-phenyl)propionate hydroxylase
VDASPVVVVGAGPTGLTAALLLATYGIDVQVLEQHRGVLDQPRAVHLDDEAVRVLARADVAEGFARIARPAQGLRLLDEHHGVLAEFPRRDTGPHGYPQANLFHQPDLERLLRDRVAAVPNITLTEGVEVVDVRTQQPHGPTVVTRDCATGARSELPTAAVLGCDGANSLVRERIGTRMRVLAPPQRWFVLDARCRDGLGQWDGVHQVCSGHRASTFLRVGIDRYRWEFRLHEADDPATLASPAGLRQLLAPWGVRPEDVEVLRAAAYTYRAELAERWQQGRTFLLGDAAHLSPPFTGQGLGAGLRDALNLAWKLVAVLGGADEALLATYERERRAHARSSIRLAHLVGRAMTAAGVAGDVARSVVVPRLRTVPGLRAAARSSATPALGNGPLVRRGRLGQDRLAGSLVPEPLVAGLGRFVVVSEPGCAAADRLARLLGAVRPGPDDRLLVWLRRNHVRAAVIRPDGAILATTQSTEQLCRLYGELHPLFSRAQPLPAR